MEQNTSNFHSLKNNLSKLLSPRSRSNSLHVQPTYPPPPISLSLIINVYTGVVECDRRRRRGERGVCVLFEFSSTRLFGLINQQRATTVCLKR